MKAQRLQKLLAHAGYGSRRRIESWIAEGRVQVNGRPATLGDTATVKDQVRIDGRAVNLAKAQQAASRVLAYKKYAGQVVTRRDPQGRPTVFRGLPRLEAGRWLTVGRLDINTSGVLLMTTDGELKARLEHPRNAIEREYAVRVHGVVTQTMLERLTSGVELDDGRAAFARLSAAAETRSSNRWFNVVVQEGRNRLVRRLWASQGVEVSRLIRVRYGPVELPGGVRAGRGRELDKRQVRALAQLVDLKR